MGMMKSTLRILIAAAICAVPSSVAYAQCTAAVTDGLIGYWRMDDTSGNTIVDSSGTGNTGTWYDDTDNAITTESVSGQVDTALDLENGDNSYILVDTDASISNTTRSVCLWINPESSLSNYKSLVDKADGSDNGWNLYYNGSGQRVGWYTNYGGYIELANGTMPVGVWQHYCATWDGNDGFSGMALYKDGQLATPNSSGDVGGYMSDAGNQLYIGGSIADSGNGFDGIMDQVMLFSRELSAAEVQAIYEGQVAAVTGDEGAIVFNQDHALMQYCDGTDWRMMGVGSYVPNGVQFDGSTISFTHSSPLTDVVDGKTFTGSFWYQNDEFGSEIVIQSDGAAFMIKAQDWGSGPRLTFRTENEAGTVLMQYEVDAPEDADWHHVLFSFDQANPANNRLYLDGVNETFYEYGPGTPIDDIVDFTRPSIYFGFNSSAEHFDGKIADFWLEKNLFMDLDIEANRRKFISEAGLPMYLGEDGSIPTGVSPDIFLSGDTADWHTNKGTGGGFTESGVLTQSSLAIGNTAGIDISSGLIAHWKFDEDSGSAAADSSDEGNDGSLDNGTPVWEQGIYGNASSGAEFGATTITGFSTSAVTVSGWAKVTSHADYSDMVNFQWGSGTGGYNLISDSTGDLTFGVMQGGSQRLAIASNVINLDEWMFWTGTYDGTDVDLYLNGTLLDTANYPGITLQTTGPFYFSDSNGDVVFDDIRIFNRALSETEVAALYRLCGAGNKGTIQYDDAFNVMKYCNGVEWVAMGPVGGAPVTDGLMGHWTLDETSGTFADSSGNGNTGTQSGGVSYEEEGVLANAVGFDGVDDHVQVTHSASLTTADDLSLSFWIKLHEDPDDLPNAVWRIMDKHPGFADGDPGWWLLINGYYKKLSSMCVYSAN